MVCSRVNFTFMCLGIIIIIIIIVVVVVVVVNVKLSLYNPERRMGMEV